MRVGLPYKGEDSSGIEGKKRSVLEQNRGKASAMSSTRRNYARKEGGSRLKGGGVEKISIQSLRKELIDLRERV